MDSFTFRLQVITGDGITMYRTSLLIQYKYTIRFLAIASTDYSAKDSTKLSHVRFSVSQLDNIWWSLSANTLLHAFHFHPFNFIPLNSWIVNRWLPPFAGLRSEVTAVPHSFTSRPRSPMFSAGGFVPPWRGELHFFTHGSVEPSPFILIKEPHSGKPIKLHITPPAFIPISDDHARRASRASNRPNEPSSESLIGGNSTLREKE